MTVRIGPGMGALHDDRFGVLLVAHGNLGTELLATAAKIAGELEGFAALSLGWDDDRDAVEREVRQAVEELAGPAGVLVLTDMYGSTPSNAALKLAEPGRVEVLTGMNLPMVVRLACLAGRRMALAEAAGWLQAKGRSSICLARETGSAAGGGSGEPDPCDGGGP